MTQIIIQLQGGLVQNVFTKGTGNISQAIIVDEDTEGSEEITFVKDYEACIHSEQIIPLPEKSDVDLIVNKYQETKVKQL